MRVGGKLYHMGFHPNVARSTLAEANESRDGRIYADFAQTLIATARQLYAGDTLSVDLDQSLYALDSTIIDQCLALFPWARFRRRKAAVKMHTLLDLRGWWRSCANAWNWRPACIRFYRFSENVHFMRHSGHRPRRQFR